ncbi:MAG: POTRA domain-containing protein [Pseudomonadota bacterium]
MKGGLRRGPLDGGAARARSRPTTDERRSGCVPATSLPTGGKPFGALATASRRILVAILAMTCAGGSTATTTTSNDDGSSAGTSFDFDAGTNASTIADADADADTDADTGTPVIAGYRITGDLQESEAALRQILDPLLLESTKTLAAGEAAGGLLERARARDRDSRRGKRWDAERRKAIEALCRKLGYDLEIREKSVLPASVAAVGVPTTTAVVLELGLSRQTKIRRIVLDDGESLFSHLFAPNLLERELLSRMSLRPGDPLATPPEQRARELADLEARLVRFLQDEGYFESRVAVSVKEHKKAAEATISIRIHKGPAYEVGRVETEGNVAVASSEIVRLVEQRSRWRLLRDRFSRARLERDLERVASLYQQRGFPAVRVESSFDPDVSLDRLAKTVNFKVIIKENKHIRVSFEGNGGSLPISDADFLKATTFAAERAYDDFEAERSADSIRRLLQRDGYFQAVVTWERRHERARPGDSRGEDHFVFRIQQGPRLRVASITFTGNQAFSDAELARTIHTRAFPGKVRQYLEHGGYLTSVQLEQDVQAISKRYQAAGYAPCGQNGVDYPMPNGRVPSPSSASTQNSTQNSTPGSPAEPDCTRVKGIVATDRELFGNLGALAAAITAEQNKGGIHVLYQIDEGPQPVVRRIEYRGNHSLNDASFEKATLLRPGSPFTTAQLERDAEAIRRLYAQHGYPYVKYAENSPEARPVKGGLIDLVHTIEEGEPVRFGQMLFRGNFKTKGWVIADIASLANGELFGLERWQAGERALRATGLFSSVRLQLVGLDERQTLVNILASVREAHDNHGELGFAVGYNTNYGPFVGPDYAWRNIGGIGATLVLRGEIGLGRPLEEVMDFAGLDQQEDRWRLYGTGNLALPQWVMSRWFSLPLKLDLTAGGNKETHDRFGEISWLEGRAALSRRFGEHWGVSFGYSYRRFGREQMLIRPAGSSERVDRIPVETTTASLAATIAYDRRTDDTGSSFTLEPTKGYRLTASAQWSSRLLGGTDDFLKLSTSAQQFIPLGTRLLLKFGLRYDHGVPLRDSVLLPEVERFFAGGDTTVRGIEKDHLATEVVRGQAGAVTFFKLLPVGGNIRLLANIDLQLKAWENSFIGLPLATAVFLDSGLVTQSFDGFEIADLRHSVGLALARIIIPGLGSISLEYAIPLDPQIGDNPLGRFHFNLGFVF